MVALIYFEDKVHLKKFQRGKKYSLFFPQVLSTNLEYYDLIFLFLFNLDKRRNIIVGKFTLFLDDKEV